MVENAYEDVPSLLQSTGPRHRRAFGHRILSLAKGSVSGFLVAIVLGSIAIWLAGAARPILAEEDDGGLPPFNEVIDVTERHFIDKSGWNAGDLISRSDAEEVIESLDHLGWWVNEQESISEAVLGDSAFLVRKLGTRSGTKFMRRIARYPQVYDRLDRLSRISGGRKLVSDLISGKGGYEMIEYLSTSRGGENLGRMLKNAKNGSDLNRQTGRIYTARQLIEALREAYDEEKATLLAEQADESDDDDNEDEDEDGDEDGDEDEDEESDDG